MQECHVSRVNNYVIWNYILYWGKKFEKISNTAQKMKFSMKDFFRKCGKIRSFLLIWSHLLKKPFIENFIFCAVYSIFVWYYYFLHPFFPVLFAYHPIFTDFFSQKSSMNVYCPVAVMKKYAQLMVHFPWFRSPWWIVKKGGSFLNRGK